MVNKENSLIGLLVDNNSVNVKSDAIQEPNDNRYLDIIESLTSIIRGLNIKITSLEEENKSLRNQIKR